MSSQVYYFLLTTAIFILLSWSLYLPYRAGQLYFVPISCMALAGYIGGLAARDWGWPVVLVLLLGAGIGIIMALLLALVIGDSPLFAVVIVGLAFVFIVRTTIENLEVFGTTVGLFGIPRPENLLLIAYIILVIVGFLIYRVERSHFGKAASVLFIDKDLAASLGIKHKSLGILFQTIAGGIGGLTGVIYAFLLGSLNPSFFSFSLIGTLMCMLFIGGHTTMWGVLISVPVLWGLPIFLTRAIAEWRLFFYAGLLIVILVVQPEGLITRKTVAGIVSRYRLWLGKIKVFRKTKVL